MAAPGFDVHDAARTISQFMPDQQDVMLRERNRDPGTPDIYWSAQRLPQTESLSPTSMDGQEDVFTQTWRFYQDIDSPQTHLPTTGDKFIVTSLGDETWEIIGLGQVVQNMGRHIFNVEAKLDQ